ncbi:MAG: phosphatidylglycerophosphatase A family protein [Thermodesulfobacteriota bacterium]
MIRLIIIFLASGAFCGFLPYAPGTFGSLLGLILFYFISPFPPTIYLLSLITFFFLAVWLAYHGENIFKLRDSPKIVIDEIVGCLVSLSFVPPSFLNLIGGFLFFRIFDIIKPPPINLVHHRLSGGWAVVLDDLIAGLLANILLQILNYWW